MNYKPDERCYDFFRRQRSISEPPQDVDPDDRFSYKYPHDFITVDDLHYYRRRAPPDQRISRIQLFDSQSEPAIPGISEYSEEYHGWPSINRPPLLRKDTNLRLPHSGSMDILTEQKENFVPYSREDLLGSRPALVRIPETLRLTGDIELFPEYRSQFCAINMTHQLPKKIIRPAPLVPSPKKEQRPLDTMKERIERTHLGLDGDRDLEPEYKSKYTTFPMERSKLMPQGSHLSMQGRFHGVPEYQDSFRNYEKSAKSAPIKKADNLRPAGKILANPEYSERFREPDMKKFEKRDPYRKPDNLCASGEFTKDLPEYYESFKDHHITAKPEKGKCRDTYFKLSGETNWDAEYRTTYTDFPRARPVVKKPDTHIRLSGQVVTPPHRFKGYRIPENASNRDSIETYMSQPEIRKAQLEQLIRPRPPTRGDQNAQRFISNVTESEPKKEPEIEKLIPPASPKAATADEAVNKLPPRSPFKVVVEDFDQKVKRSTPRFGRRRPPSDDDYTAVRTRTNVIEGNPAYVRYSTDYMKDKNAYQEAVETRQRKTAEAGRRRSPRKSPSTSEERERAAPSPFQKESFTTSSDARESSEEPFRVLDDHEYQNRSIRKSAGKFTPVIERSKIAGNGWRASYDENSNEQPVTRHRRRQFDVNQNTYKSFDQSPNGWMQPSWYDLKY